MGGMSMDGGDFRSEEKPVAPAPSAPLSDTFNRQSYTANKYSDYVLRVSAGYYECYYDFKARVVIIKASQGVTTTPFAQMDQGALIEARNELLRQGGKPPASPAETAAGQKPPTSLNL